MREEWRRVTLGDVAEHRIEPVNVDSEREYNLMGIRWRNLGAYKRGDSVSAPAKARTMYRMHAGDFVFNRIDTDKGAFCVVDADQDRALASNEFPAYKTNSDVLLADWLWLYFQQDSVLASIRPAGSEGRARWKEADFERLSIGLPPLAEQRRIVDLIGAFDEGIEAAVAEDLAAGQLYKSLLAEMNDGRFPFVKVADAVVAARAGGTPSRTGVGLYGPGIPWLKSGEVNRDFISTASEEITEDGLQASSAWVVPAGATVVAMYGQGNTKGTAGWLECPMATNQAVLALMPHPSKTQSRFLLHALRSRTGSLRSRAAGAAQPNLSKSLVLEEIIPFPTIVEQGLVAARLDVLREVQSAAQALIESQRTLRSELLTSLVSGEHEIPASYDRLLGASTDSADGAGSTKGEAAA